MNAAYARQSVEKKNSISIEGQIELCENTAGEKLKVYQDRGYSGKNTDRPGFQKLLKDIDAKVEQGDVEGAKELCRNTRGPVASVCYQGLMHIKEPIDDVERSIMSYGTVQVANMEKGCSWIKLFIALAPSLGFLGTVIGMVMAFDQIQELGDINPTIVASGMKVALITTIFGIVVAVILQLFYNYIVSKIEHLTSQMEESAVTLLDTITQFKRSRNDV